MFSHLGHLPLRQVPGGPPLRVPPGEGGVAAAVGGGGGGVQQLLLGGLHRLEGGGGVVVGAEAVGRPRGEVLYIYSRIA